MTAGNVIDFTTLGEDIQELIRESVVAREMSYAPYSRFKVGAAIRCKDDSITRGCNVENASYPVGICAERAAIVRAISEGKRQFVALAVTAPTIEDVISSPCGLCRQTIAEFGDIPIYLSSPDMSKVFKTSLQDLLPVAFGLNGVSL